MIQKHIKILKEKIVKTQLFNLVTVRIHQVRRRQELKELFGHLIEKYQMEPMEKTFADEKVSNYIWVCWWQGEKDMSPIVHKCYEHIGKFNTDKQVVLITEENVGDYVTFPPYISEKYKRGIISKTNLSDFLRAELLCQYGGVWMDITLMTWTGIPGNFYELPVYTGRYHYNRKDYNVSRNRWASFFWVSRYPNNILFRYLSDFWREYWKKMDCLMEYFLIDYAIDLGYRNIFTIKKELDMIPVNGCGKDVWELLKILPDSFDKETIERIKKENWMQKLSYKGENRIQERATTSEKSVYKYLFLSE